MSQGIPRAIEKLVVTARWNDFDGIEKLMKKHELAAVICEPVMGNAGVISPRNGFLKHLRQLCDKYGVVLIFDEVKTGFRLANGGAQEVFHVKPDMSTFSKSLGNGYPIAAFTGRREVMDVIGPEKVVHGGTFSSNPVSLTAALATLHELQRKNVVGHMQSYGRKLIKGFIQILSDRDLDFMI